jgi:hypothetical protein
LLNYYAVAEEVERGLLIATSLEGRGIPWRLDLAVNRSRRQSLAVSTMLDILMLQARDLVASGGLNGSLHLHPEAAKAQPSAKKSLQAAAIVRYADPA